MYFIFPGCRRDHFTHGLFHPIWDVEFQDPCLVACLQQQLHHKLLSPPNPCQSMTLLFQ